MSSFALAAPSGFISEALQIVGALVVLAPFAAAQLRVITPQSRVYLLLNLAGSAPLALLAAVHKQYGFLLLEGAWAFVSAWGLLSLARGRPPETPGHGPSSSHPPRKLRRPTPTPAGWRSRWLRSAETYEPVVLCCETSVCVTGYARDCAAGSSIKR